jgi:hypothetical protein
LCNLDPSFVAVGNFHDPALGRAHLGRARIHRSDIVIRHDGK